MQAIMALGVDQAAGHTEVRLTANGPVIMEVAARLGGGFISSHLVPLSSGIDLIAATIRVALGETPDLNSNTRTHAAAIRFICPVPGVIAAIDGVEAARHLEGMEEIEIYKLPGQRVPPLMDARGRAGHVIFTADTPDDAIKRAERALASIHIHTVA